MNGYVLVPESHPWHEGLDVLMSEVQVSAVKAWSRVVNASVSIHGGITEVRPPWVGFHTHHPGDWWPYEYDPMGRCSRRLSKFDALRIWTPEMVERETRGLAMQVAAIGQAWIREQQKVAEAKMARFRHLDLDF